MTTKTVPVDQFLSARYAEESAAGGDEAAIQSKTKILVRCQEALMTVGPGSMLLVNFAKWTLLDLARAYEHHPEYRGEEWKWEMR